MDSPLVGHSSSNPPGIYPVHGERGILRYWDGREWAGGPAASIWSRSWGNLVDVVIATIVFTVMLFLFAIPASLAFPEPDTAGQNASFSIALLAAVLVGFVGYFALCYRFWGRTIGMVFAGIYIIHIPTGQERLPWGPSVIRALILCAGYICGLVWIIWLLITAASRAKQGPHDLAAKTGVLSSRVHAPPLTSSATPTPEASGEVTGKDSHKSLVDETLEEVSPDQTSGQLQASVTPEAQTPSSEPTEEPGSSTDSPSPASSSSNAMATIFISHASQDGAIAESLADALEAQGLDTWLASRDVSIGANYAAEIFQNLVNSDYLLVVLSPHSIESAHVRREVSIAIDRKVPVLPVSTDPSGELMANLPEDWQYWLNIAQVFRMTDESSTAIEIARRVK